MPGPLEFVLILLVLLIIVIVARSIRVVQQARAYVIERLGAYSTTWCGTPFQDPLH